MSPWITTCPVVVAFLHPLLTNDKTVSDVLGRDVRTGSFSERFSQLRVRPREDSNFRHPV